MCDYLFCGGKKERISRQIQNSKKNSYNYKMQTQSSEEKVRITRIKCTIMKKEYRELWDKRHNCLFYLLFLGSGKNNNRILRL